MGRIAIAVALSVYVGSVGMVDAAKSGPCRPSTSGLSVAMADTFGFAYRCRGLAQTFEASDSAMTALTVWSPPRDNVDFQPRTLFILGTFPSGEPNQFDVIYGPDPLVVPDVTPGAPIAYHYAFDPPIMLPGPGKYALVIQASDFNGYGMAAVRHDTYPGGMLCVTGPIFGCTQPGGARCDAYPGWDMCFEVEFCSDGTVATRKHTWGVLKMLYR